MNTRLDRAMTLLRTLVDAINDPNVDPHWYEKVWPTMNEARAFLREVPAQPKVRVEAFQNVIVSDVSARAEVEKIIQRMEMIWAPTISIERDELVIYCRTPEEAGRLKMRLQARLDP